MQHAPTLANRIRAMFRHLPAVQAASDETLEASWTAVHTCLGARHIPMVPFYCDPFRRADLWQAFKRRA